MNIFMLLFLHLALAFLGTAHPGDHGERSATDNTIKVQKGIYHSNVIQGYSRCAKNLESSGLNKRATLRRRIKIDEYRQDLAIRRQEQKTLLPHRKPDDQSTFKHIFHLPDQLEKSHLVTDPSIGPDTPTDELFSNNGTCVLNPDSLTGPFYIQGELIRSDVTDGQAGVPMIIDTQIIDVDSCEPLQGVWWDIWSCNATGVYSGIQTWGNGDENDASNLNTTFLRGLQQTDSEGVAQLQAIFPGHYLSQGLDLSRSNREYFF
ncbi:aromatic compound dioxygenase [Penicillium angulare]|uniref:Aromatic compound dioxygenase n=1 Tax=Penicillium angulare TaxID=116970 RepID=A0A9W9K6J2_9EURO|nr:aromatic compound dioxygenase [Penicillium angulare]